MALRRCPAGGERLERASTVAVGDLLEREPRKDGESGRRSYYRITRLGRRVAEAEAGRLDALLRSARDGGLLTDR